MTASRLGHAGRDTRAAHPWCGVLLMDKPPGLTSHDLVDRARRRFRMRAIGHLGTLDPGATGLLVLAMDAATRCAGVWQGGGKTYRGTVVLGVRTDSQDLTGQVLERRPVDVDEAALRAASDRFVGVLSQVPPMVSALKVRGKRLYELARRGVEVERAPRPVRVDAWRWTAIALPSASFEIRCSSGTYVRTLVDDLGRALGCGAALERLRRLRSEPFELGAAVTLAELNALGAEGAWARAGIPLERALAGIPSVVLDAARAEALGYGRTFAVGAAESAGAPVGAGPRSVWFADPDGSALALGELSARGDALEGRPHVVFPWAVRQNLPIELG